jgi:hypothetical protein
VLQRFDLSAQLGRLLLVLQQSFGRRGQAVLHVGDALLLPRQLCLVHRV